MGSINGNIDAGPTLRDDMGNPCIPAIIDGEPIVQSSSASFPVTSASTQKIVHYGQNTTVEIANKAVEQAAATFKSYRLTPVHERREMLLKAADLFENRVEEARHRAMIETSCGEEWARYNAMQTAQFIRDIAAKVAGAVTGEVPPSYFGFTSLVFKEPVGPILLIPPWNAALVLSTRGVASALAAGCTVVLKASELCPWTHQLIIEIFHEAGFPPGAISLIMADRVAGPEITEKVIEHPAIRKVEFIGSAAVGKIIGSIASKNLKPVLMELGDQSPAIVMEDADLEKAAQLCARGAMAHQGQVCFSTERIIVQSSIKDDFLRLLVEAVKRIPSGGTSITATAAEKARKNIDAAITDGASFLYGDNKMNGPASVGVSILTNVNPKSAISTSESFAPAAFIKIVETEDEAIEEANSRIGGLAASVFTKNYERGLHMARELEFGAVQINNMTLFAEPSGPVTGHKGSGWGSSNGRYGIEEFLYQKAVSLVPTEDKFVNVNMLKSREVSVLRQ